jgi:hypothetical protein
MVKGMRRQVAMIKARMIVIALAAHAHRSRFLLLFGFAPLFPKLFELCKTAVNQLIN